MKLVAVGACQFGQADGIPHCRGLEKVPVMRIGNSHIVHCFDLGRLS